MATPLDPQQSLPELELRVLARWRERDVAREALRRRSGAPSRVIWERPAAAVGPGLLDDVPARVLADVFARYAVMRGWDVERRAVRECHGLAVELEVERRSGLSCAELIGRDGMGELDARCRAVALASAAERDALSERLGVQAAPSRTTLDPDYVESVWWAVKELSDHGLVYEDVRVQPHCPHCAVAPSADEIVRRFAVEPAAYVRFKVARDGGPLQAGDELAIWTAAPWTLVANAAVAVDPELTYVRVKTGTLEAPVVVAEALAEQVLGGAANVRILDRFRGAAIDGVRYEPPFGYLAAAAFGERGHSVLLAGFVTASEGTGLAATTMAFAEDDLRLGARFGLEVVNPVRSDGTFDERAGRYAGRPVAEAQASLVEDLRVRGRLLRAEQREHHAPHCASCSTRLLPYAKASWYLATAQLSDALSGAGAGGARISRDAADRVLSRERYFGTPQPVWRCADGHVTVVGSFDELEQRSGARIDEPHRPWVDDVVLTCECGMPAARVPDLVTPWFQAGAMPFARRHEPFDGRLTLDELYPADLACDGRSGAWIDALLTVSALLRGGESAVEHDVRARVFDAPAGLLELEGADALRWHVVTGEPASFLRTLRTACAFAAANPCEPTGAPRSELDRWIASRLSATIEIAGERMDAYDAPAAAHAIAAFAGELCEWYATCAGERVRDGDEAARATLRDCLVALAQLLAPLTPFVADELYEGLGGSEPSVHLTDWPVAAPRDLELEAAIGLARADR
ncbi:MAG: isoleucyl-tRNA synthetase [Gaiellales bacterium]|nr:isoleucyl-tRNA synthetase [Gaiellales bacterium]